MSDPQSSRERPETPPPAVRRVLVTAAPPTPNGDLHLGHLSGPYLSADFHTRYLRLRGIDAHYACGTDDHCMYVERQGEQMGLTGLEAARRFTDAIEETLAMAGIGMSVFMRPDASPYFEPLVLELFDRLWREGKIEEREQESPYCESCSRYLFEADVSGRCPHCGAGLTGNTCESCGRVNDCIDIVDARCTACGSPAAAKRFTRLFFPTSRYGEALTRYHAATTMNVHLRAFCERSIADGLPDVAISHVSDWGIRVPLEHPGFESQTLYVWFEMAARYFAYGEHVNEASGVEADYGRFWRDGEARIVQFFGFDNSFYYALLLPAIYLAFDEGLRLPSAFVINEFYRLDGEKFSTSRGHSILGRTLLDSEPRDRVRWYLARTCPEREETNFTLAEFEATVDRELVRGLGPWLRELDEKLRAEHGGLAPRPGKLTPEHRELYRQLGGFVEAAAEAYEPESFSPQRLTRTLSELVRTARRFGKGENHWRGVPRRRDDRRTGLALELLAAKVWAVAAAPVMPGVAASLWRGLGLGEGPGPGCWDSALDWVPAGQPLGDLAAELDLGIGHGKAEMVAQAGVG